MITIRGQTSLGPNIVTNGLALHLDSMNANSYPGSGSIWYDLSGNGNNGTMNNFSGPSAGSTSGFDTNTKLMMFDRHLGSADGTVNNIVNFSSSTTLLDCLCQNGVSIEFWLKVTTTVCTAIAKLHGSWEIYYCSGLVFRTEGAGGNDGSTSIGSGTYFPNMHHILATHDDTNRKVYVNGINVLSDVNSVTSQSFSSFGLGGYSNGIYAFVGAIPIFKVYSRALTQPEVLQNFNALRNKFGL